MLEYGLGKLLSSQKLKNEKKKLGSRYLHISTMSTLRAGRATATTLRQGFIVLSFHFQNSVNRLNQDHKTFLVK